MPLINAQAEGVTELLHKWHDGDGQALDELIGLVYAELQHLAWQCLRGERAGHSVHTGTLVHEAYLKLAGCHRLEWNDRGHFFAIAGRVMRRVLVEEARRRNSLKRGEGGTALLLDEGMIVSHERDAELIALDEALERLARRFKRKAQVIELRYFVGLTIEETAEALGVKADTVKREWRTGKLWLQRELGGAEAGNGSSNGKSAAAGTD